MCARLALACMCMVDCVWWCVGVCCGISNYYRTYDMLDFAPRLQKCWRVSFANASAATAVADADATDGAAAAAAWKRVNLTSKCNVAPIFGFSDLMRYAYAFVFMFIWNGPC